VNQPPEEYVVVTEPELLRFSHDCFESAGLRGDHAQLISRLLVNSDLRGVRSHGTRQVDGYCAAFEEGELNPDPVVSVVKDHGAVVAMDGDGSLGYLPMVRATEAAIERAKQHGLGMATVAIRRSASPSPAGTAPVWFLMQRREFSPIINLVPSSKN
jgi:LDH2 family malate/lactate/ureidoglycolate dehydrogenase